MLIRAGKKQVDIKTVGWKNRNEDIIREAINALGRSELYECSDDGFYMVLDEDGRRVYDSLRSDRIDFQYKGIRIRSTRSYYITFMLMKECITIRKPIDVECTTFHEINKVYQDTKHIAAHKAEIMFYLEAE